MVGNHAHATANGTPSTSSHTPTALKRWSCDEDHPLPPVSQIKAIHVYDFDNTLFASPLPNRNIWDASTVGTLMAEKTLAEGGWFHNNSILGATGEGIEKEEPRAWAGWWNEQVAKLCELSHEQKDAFSVLLTGRGEARFAELIKRMLKRPANQTFRSTMNFKQILLTDIVNTYHEAEEIKIYEDRPGHVTQFRDFFSDFNRDLMGPNPQSQRRTIACDVIEVTTKATSLDPVTEIAEIQKMVNSHNIAFKSGTLQKGSPMQLDRKILNAGYLVSPSDVERLATLMPAIARSNPNVRVLAHSIRITVGPPLPNALQEIGGVGKQVRFRVTGMGILDNRIWAASVEPVPSNEKIKVLDRPPAVILGMHNNAHFRDLTRIENWTPIAAAQATEFETTIGEKVTLSIVPEQRGNTRVGQNNRKRPYDNEGTQQDYTGSGPVPQNSNKRSNSSNNYRGGRGRDRRDEGGRSGRGRGGHQRGGGAGGGNYGRGGGRSGRNGGQQQHHRQPGEDFGAQRGGYTDYDAAGRNDGGSGMYNAY